MRTDRRANAPALEQAAERLGVTLSLQLQAAVRDGFDAAGGDDPFDAFAGLLGMLNVVRGDRGTGEPNDPTVRNVEGWILGQQE